MKMQDSMADFIASKLDVPDLVRGWFPGYVADGMVTCPHHDDKNASLHISTEGKALCHGCGWKACNVIDLYAKMEGGIYSDARRVLYEQVVHAIGVDIVGVFQTRLAYHKPALTYLDERGITPGTTSQFRLGYDPHTKRIAIPIFDQFNTCINMRLMAFHKSKFKAINTKGHGEVRLYPEWLAMKEDKLLLVEGEWDCLIGRQLRLPTVTWTGGAGSWNHNYDWLFKGKNVMVMYDNDAAGVVGTHNTVNKLVKVANMTTTQLVPKEAGKDLNDWLLADGFSASLNNFVKRFNSWNPPFNQVQEVETKPGYCPACGRRYEDETKS